MIRPITLADATGTREVYRPYVEDSTISFEYNVPSLDEWRSRISLHSSDYPWIVCEIDGQIAGYAYGSKHRSRTAYSWSAESTVYLSEKFHGMGIARVLYETLFRLLKLYGYVNVYAGVTMPNEKSEAFHKALGFYDVGVFRNIGFKFGKWHHTRWFQLHLNEHDTPPQSLINTEEIKINPEYQVILQESNRRIQMLP